MDTDLATSTVLIDGRRFPACGMICPPTPDQEDSEPADRLLGGWAHPLRGPATCEVVIPAENGVLIAVEWAEDKPVYFLRLYARSCSLYAKDPEGPLWLPRRVGLRSGYLAGFQIRSSVWYWNDAYPDWTVEFIDRMSTLKYYPPLPGPAVELINLAQVEELLKGRSHGRVHTTQGGARTRLRP